MLKLKKQESLTNTENSKKNTETMRPNYSRM